MLVNRMRRSVIILNYECPCEYGCPSSLFHLFRCLNRPTEKNDMNNEFLREHFEATRRHFLKSGIVFSGVAAHASHQALSLADNSPSEA
jgi:hypothetical protein